MQCFRNLKLTQCLFFTGQFVSKKIYHKDLLTIIETDRDRQRQTETDRDRQRQTETDRDRQRQTETNRDRQRQTETDRDRQRHN